MDLMNVSSVLEHIIRAALTCSGVKVVWDMVSRTVKKHPPDWSFNVLLCLLSAGCDLIGRCVDEQTYLFWGRGWIGGGWSPFL